MTIRLSKIILVAAIAFYCLLAAFGNITDYNANFPLVQQALIMKDIFPSSGIAYRAVTNPMLHHVVYVAIIGFEALTMLICLIGAWKLFRVRHAAAKVFNQAKSCAVWGLTLGVLTWQVLFMSIGGEWFGFWMSQLLSNVLSTAFQIFMTIFAVLIYLVIKDD